jgi:hypothetical protein
MNHLTPECLETDRLLLRTFRENDWKDLHKYYSDEECTKYTIGRTLTEGESWRTMAAMNKQFKLDGDPLIFGIRARYGDSKARMTTTNCNPHRNG